MAVELVQKNDNYWEMYPGPFDVHTHPRAYDPITPDDFVPGNGGMEGKAGVAIFTREALRSGITGIAAMPNEQQRRLDIDAIPPEQTIVTPHPISTLQRVEGMQGIILAQAVIPTAVHFGLDPESSDTFWLQSGRLREPWLRKEFEKVHDECFGFKVYLADTTGGYNVAPHHGPQLAEMWHYANPKQPVIFHVEGGDVGRLLRSIYELPKGRGKNLPVHIAHVSSREELEAVIWAKELGMNVTCEVTPHHLFMDETTGAPLGGYGCMKPSLKTKEDQAFLWANMHHIDMFASDCAPHRRSDKEAADPAFGVTNHKIMIPLLLGAVADGRLTMDDLYQKLCINPRKRFNLPLEDGSMAGINTLVSHSVEDYERAEYGFSPFGKLAVIPRMIGEIVVARAGESEYRVGQGDKGMRLSHKHVLRPKNFKVAA